MAEPLEFVGTGPIPPGLHLETREELATKLTIAESANAALMRQLKEARHQAEGMAETVVRLKGVIGYMACLLSENYIRVFTARDIEHGCKDCRVDVEPDVIRVSNLGS
jgi:hypothetical protein